MYKTEFRHQWTVRGGDRHLSLWEPQLWVKNKQTRKQPWTRCTEKRQLMMPGTVTPKVCVLTKAGHTKQIIRRKEAQSIYLLPYIAILGSNYQRNETQKGGGRSTAVLSVKSESQRRWGKWRQQIQLQSEWWYPAAAMDNGSMCKFKQI